MKVLITGGAGFLGSHLADALIALGHQVIAIDHHHREKLRFPNPSVVMHKVGFEHETVEEVFANERPDVICHLAAQISVTKSIAQPLLDAQRNVVNSLEFLRLAQKYGCKKFIFASSGGAIYGDHPIRPTPLLEDAIPLSPYGVGKQSFEWYLEQQFRVHGLPYVSLRLSNLYGPRQQLSSVGEGNVVCMFLNHLLRGTPITIFGDGGASRDYIYATDAVAAFVRAMESEYSGVVNVSTGRETTVRELFDTLIAIHGKDHPLLHEPFRNGEVMRSVLSYDSARELLQWEPKMSLRDGLEETYKWFMGTFSGR